MDIQAKDIYQFGPRFGRGSKAIYEGFKLKEDPEAKQAMPKEKFMKVSKEKFNTYSGDYLLLPTKDGKKPNNDFVKSNTWKIIKLFKTVMLFIILWMKQFMQI
ncbi:hypothetical protein QI124_01470 [Staphylococcus saprophyticus]|nr:hypothetical protein [Staphylococcus saprophyticus]